MRRLKNPSEAVGFSYRTQSVALRDGRVKFGSRKGRKLVDVLEPAEPAAATAQG